MRTVNKAFIGALSLLLSNFAFADDKLDGPISFVLDIFMRAPFGFTLLLIFAFFFYKHSSK